VKREKDPVCGSSVGENRRMGRLIQADRRATLTEMTTRYNRGVQQSICEAITTTITTPQ